MSNQELVNYENSLDYREPDVIYEILKRAEEFEEGITEKYESSFDPDSEFNTDDLFDRAVSLILDEEDSRFPHGYAEIEYADMDTAEAREGAKFDDLNFLRHFER